MTNSDAIEKLEDNLNDILIVANNCPLSCHEKKQDGRWSILEIFEHIYLTEKIVHKLLLKEAIKENEYEEILGRAKLKKMLVNGRSYKIIAPAYLTPLGSFENLNLFFNEFSRERNTLIQDVRLGKIVMDNRVHNHPVLGDMTMSDWINFLIYHSIRHLEQVNDNLTFFNEQSNLNQTTDSEK